MAENAAAKLPEIFSTAPCPLSAQASESGLLFPGTRHPAEAYLFQSGEDCLHPVNFRLLAGKNCFAQLLNFRIGCCPPEPASWNPPHENLKMSGTTRIGN
jgi:hypothetical protein